MSLQISVLTKLFIKYLLFHKLFKINFYLFLSNFVYEFVFQMD